jgi:hypothetical protein
VTDVNRERGAWHFAGETAPALDLERSGLRFADGDEEASYRDWYLDEARAVAVTAFTGAIVMWLGACIAVVLVFDDGLRRGAPLCVGMVLCNAAALTLVRRRSFRRHVLVTAAITNVIAGFTLLALGDLLLTGDAELTALNGVMVVIIFFGF